MLLFDKLQVKIVKKKQSNLKKKNLLFIKTKISAYADADG